MAGDKTYIADSSEKLHRATMTKAVTPTDIVWSSNPNDYTVQVLVDGKWHRAVLTCDVQTESFFSDPNIDKALVTGTDGKTHTALIVAPQTAGVVMSKIPTDDHSTLADTTTGETALNVYSEEWSDIQWQDNVNVYKVLVTGSDGKVHTALLTTQVVGTVEVIVSGVPPLYLLGAVEDSLSELKAFGGTKLSYDIPLEYTQIDYAIKKGTAGVQGKFDTGIKPTVDDVKIEIKVKIGDEAQASGQTTVGSFYACQARATASGDITGISGSSASGSINGMQSGQSVASGIVRVKDHIDLISYEYKNGNHSIYVKDLTTNTEDTQTGTYTFSAPTKNLYIFGNTTTTNNLNNNNALYYCKIWVSGSLAFDAVPVIRNSDNVVGLYDKVSQTFIEPIISEGGGFVAGDATAPTPSDPMDIYCNNGALKILDKSDWTIFTNPTSVAGQGVFINSTGKWQAVGDRGAGCAIPLTIGKQYTLVIHKKTISLGQMLRYGQSPQATPTSAGIQLTDWYRGGIADGQMVSFVAKQPYLVMQLGADPTEAGMIQEAVEVLEAQGGDYTFLKYIEATGTQYIETGLSGPARWVGAGQGTSEGTGSQCILSCLVLNESLERNANYFVGSRVTTYKYWAINTNAGGNSGVSTVPTLNYAEYDIVFTNNKQSYGIINNDNVFYEYAGSASWTYNEWYIGVGFGANNVEYYFTGNIYRQQAYQNNVLVGDFIPAIRNSDSVVGMYDAVSGTFFTNAGTGTFVAGTVIGDGEVLKLTPSNDTAGVANLFKIDNYVDTQEILTGLINHQLGIYVFDGTEDWTWSSGANAPARLNIPETAYVLSEDVAPVMCSHFIPTSWNSLSPTTKTTPYVAANQSNQPTAKRIVFTTAWDANITDLAGWKTFLATQYAAGTPVIIVYPLATAQDEVAPVPQTMQTVAGDNVLDIVQAGMGGLEVSATYMKGVSVTISEVENANIGNDVEVVIA